MLKNKYPKVNFIGNKEKLTPWICSHIPCDVNSVFDAFSGGSSVGYALKTLGYKVYSNDILRVNYLIAKALIENNSTQLSNEDVEKIFSGQPFDGFMTQYYANKLFYIDECRQLDLYRKNIEAIQDEYKKALAYILMRRAMIRKMPYSRFNIKWDKVEVLRDEDYSYQKYGRRRAYHNQSFEYHFLDNLESYHGAIFDNGLQHEVYNEDIFKLLDTTLVNADLIYLDPPYAGTMNNYFDFYNPLDEYIEHRSKKLFSNNFMDRKIISNTFEKLFSKLSAFKYCMLSYNNNAFPDMDTMVSLMEPHATDIQVITKQHNYQITGSVMKQKNEEYLFVMKLT